MSVTIQINGTDKFEMNLCTRNFCTLWSALGLEPETEHGLVGEIDGRIILVRLQTTPIAAILRESFSNTGPEGPIVHEFGITEEQAIRYFRGLDCLASHAVRREDLVLWY